ncbi:MAG: ferrous iron transport protein A [Pirellula sp.]
MVPLDLMSPNDCGVIVEMDGDPCFLKRLEEIGIQVGCNLRMVCPGSPCMVCIEGKRLSLRLDQHAEIYVCPMSKLPTSSSAPVEGIV